MDVLSLIYGNFFVYWNGIISKYGGKVYVINVNLFKVEKFYFIL